MLTRWLLLFLHHRIHPQPKSTVAFQSFDCYHYPHTPSQLSCTHRTSRMVPATSASRQLNCQLFPPSWNGSLPTRTPALLQSSLSQFRLVANTYPPQGRRYGFQRAEAPTQPRQPHHTHYHFSSGRPSGGLSSTYLQKRTQSTLAQGMHHEPPTHSYSTRDF
jgi:hypothetical protein